jgi:hypothetical protein
MQFPSAKESEVEREKERREPLSAFLFRVQSLGLPIELFRF